MSYEDLRRTIHELCRYSYCVYDSVPVTPEARLYFDRLDRGESPEKVVREFAQKITRGQVWTVRVQNKTYKLHLNSKLNGKTGSNFKNKNDKNVIDLAKLVITCLENLESVIENGDKSRFIEDDGHVNSHGVPAHPGFKWIYSKDVVEEPDLKGTVMVQMAFPPKGPKTQKLSPPRNFVYNVTASGTKRFEEREKMLERNMALQGEVYISLDA